MSRTPHNPWLELGSGPLIAPSLLACDFARLGEQADAVTVAGGDAIHIDVMDGHLVDNLSVGPPVVASLRKYTDTVLDVHIMVTDPAYYVERFIETGADSVTFHIEAADRPVELADRLHEAGRGAGVVLRPATPADAIGQVAAAVDMVLVMTVEPGFGGQDFMQDMLPKIQAVRAMLRDDQRLEVDGGINEEMAARCAAAGADVFVAGNYVFAGSDMSGAIGRLRRAAGG